MKKIGTVLITWAIVFTMQSCAVIQSATNLANCEYRMTSLTQTKLVGIDIQDASSLKSLTVLDIGKLTHAYLNKNIPLSFKLNIEARNPNAQAASLNKFDWILLIDGIEMTRGTHLNAVTIPPNNGTTTIPMDVSFNLYKAVEKDSRSALLNFAFNLADASNKPSRVDVKIKPTVYINDVPLTYPDYINVGTEFGGT